jgi:hypothetical protein
LIIGVGSTSPEPANAVPLSIVKFPFRFFAIAAKDAKDMYNNKQSPGWDLARQKRTAAVKLMQSKGILQIDTGYKNTICCPYYFRVRVMVRVRSFS